MGTTLTAMQAIETKTVPSAKSVRSHATTGQSWVFVFLLFCHTASAQWDFELEADIGVVYTDNLRLEPDGFEESEVVYTIAPIFTLTNESDRLTAQIGYRPEAFFYNDAPESDALFHTVDATVTTELVRDALFFAVGGAKFQSNRAIDGSFASTNLPITGNRVDSTVLEVRPYWEQDLGFAQILAELTYRDTTLDPEVQALTVFNQDSIDQTGQFNLNNHARRQGIAWGIQYDYRRVEYERALPFEYQTAAANLGYWFNGITRVFVSGGVETPFDSFLDPSMEADFWEAGFQFTPNQRFDIELAVGERSFGDSYRARVSLQMRRGNTVLTYNEGATTRADISSGRRPIFAQDTLGGILDRPGGSDRFIQKRGQWQTNIELAKSNLSLSIFSEDRVQRTTDAGTQLGDEQFSGATLRWSWRLGPNSTLGFQGNVGKRDFLSEDSDLTEFVVDYYFQFSQRLGVVLLARQSRESGGNSIFRQDYTENQFSLNLRARL